MTSQQISKVWTVLSLALLYYALNTYLVTQGGTPIFGATLIVSTRIPAAMMGIPICSMLLLLLCSLIGMDYARKNRSDWADRIPLVGFEQIDTASREAKFYQGTVLTLLSVLPIVALVHFWSVFSEACAVTTRNPPTLIPSIWSWSALTSLNDPAPVCNIFHMQPGASGAPSIISCEGTNTLLPGLEPTAFAVLTVAAAGVLIVLSPSPQDRSEHGREISQALVVLQLQPP
jgi:hypothetical protein